MKIELINIGTEILLGKTVNTNASFIGKILGANGYVIDNASVLPDTMDDIIAGVTTSSDRADVVIITGGLGPTCDDITIAAIKAVDGKISVIEELDNAIGMAEGQILKINKSVVIILPGVPQEMEVMFEKQAIPYILKNFPLKQKIFDQTINVCLLNEVEVDRFLRNLNETYDDIDIGIYPSYGMLQVKFSMFSDNEDAARGRLNQCAKSFCEKFETYVFPSSSKNIAHALHTQLCNDNTTLFLAESCTGGNIASDLAHIPNASKYLLGGIVAYSNDIKNTVLQVDNDVLNTFGAVSIETVRAMVKSIFDMTKAEYAIATSGIAGPSGGTKDKPVGSVFIAVAKRGDIIDAGMIQAPGNRSTIISYTTNVALGILWRRIVYNVSWF
jgi:nicotinamide-nucleotide amidase